MQTPLSRQSSAAEPRKVILLVDDEPAVLRTLAKGLERLGYTVLPAQNGLDALGYALWPGQRVDLVITDVSMPVLGGLEFVQHLHEASPKMPVVYVSGYPRSLPESTSPEAAVYFLVKPFSLEELAGVVEAMLDQSAPAAA